MKTMAIRCDLFFFAHKVKLHAVTAQHTGLYCTQNETCIAKLAARSTAAWATEHAELLIQKGMRIAKLASRSTDAWATGLAVLAKLAARSTDAWATEHAEKRCPLIQIHGRPLRLSRGMAIKGQVEARCSASSSSSAKLELVVDDAQASSIAVQDLRDVDAFFRRAQSHARPRPRPRVDGVPDAVARVGVQGR